MRYSASIITILLVFIHEQLSSQVTIDFATAKSEYKTTVKYKQSETIVIKNINRKIYNIEENNEQKDFNTAVPEAISGMTLPSFIFTGGLPKMKAATAASAPSPFPSAKRLANEDSKLDEAIPLYLAEIKRRAKKLDKAAFLHNTINHILADCNNGEAKIKTETNKRVDEYLYEPASGLNLTADKWHTRLHDSLMDMRAGAEKLLAHLQIKVPEYIALVSKDLQKDIDDAETLLTRENENLESPGLSNDKKKEIRAVIRSNKDKLEKAKKTLADFEKKAETLSEDLEKAEKAVEEMYNFEKEDKPFILLNLYDLVQHDNSFRYTAELVKAKKDKITYTFIVTPKDVNTCTKIDKKKIEVVLETEGGLKVDFSTGVFVGFGNEDFLGRTYYYKNLTDTTREIVSAERGKRLMLSVGALAHFYKRSPAKIKLAGSLGVSTTADFETLNFHAGPSLIFGKESRVILSGGLTLKTSPQLDRQLSMHKTYAVKDSPDEIPTVNVFPKAGGFLSITYNFTRFAKE